MTASYSSVSGSDSSKLSDVGVTLGEQPLAVEGEQVLLHEPAHHVADVGHLVVAEPAREALRIDQRHEGEEVLVLAVVRRRGQQQQVTGVDRRSTSPSSNRLVFRISLPYWWADILCASSTITRSQSVTSQLRLEVFVPATADRPERSSRFFSRNGLPVRDVSTCRAGHDLEVAARTSPTARPATARPGCPGRR